MGALRIDKSGTPRSWSAATVVRTVEIPLDFAGTPLPGGIGKTALLDCGTGGYSEKRMRVLRSDRVAATVGIDGADRGLEQMRSKQQGATKWSAAHQSKM
jgi:hypothetical protein